MIDYAPLAQDRTDVTGTALSTKRDSSAAGSTRTLRAVYTALLSQFDEQMALAALDWWVTQYRAQGNFSMRYFAADVQQRFAPRSSAQALLAALVRAQAQPDSQLTSDPTRTLIKYRTRRMPNGVEVQVPELEAFQMLVERWLEQADADTARDIVSYVSRQLYSLKIDRNLKRQVTNWLIKPQSRLLLVDVETRDLRAVVSLFYTGFCQFLGPVAADNALAAAMARLSANGGAAYREWFAKLL